MSLQFRFLVKIVFMLLVAAYVLSSSISAQIAVIRGWEVDSALEERKATIFATFKSGGVDADRAALDAFFDKFYFARWTRPENLGQVQGFAREFLSDLATANGNGREYLLTKSFDTLKKIVADGTATPVSRYNAMLVIGQLAQKEPAGQRLPPTPYAQALPYLIAEYKKAENPRYVQIGALLGIVRFTQIGITDDALKNTTVPTLFTETIQSGKPKPEVNEDDQEEIDWLRLLALDGLGSLKSIGVNGNIVKVLSEVIENSQESIEVRTRAAKVLGDLNFDEAGTSINFQQLGTALITLMKATGDSQLQIVTQLRDKARVTNGAVPNPQDVINISPISTEIELEFAALTPTQQQEVTGVVQSVKANVLNVLYGMRGSRFNGTPNAGILPKLPNDDPVVAKINATVNKGVSPLFKILDEGLPEDEKKKAAAASLLMDSSMGSMDYSTSRTKPKDEKQLKVNFTAVQGALQNFCDELAKIIAGG